jgi:hypothetical protein
MRGDDVAAAELSLVFGGCKFKTAKAKLNSREKQTSPHLPL